LSKKYTNVTIDSDFDLAKLLLIGLSLDDVLSVFNNEMGTFQKAIGNFSIIAAGRSVVRAITPPGMRSIYLGDTVFNQNGGLATDVLQIIIHEMGHLFDFNNSSGFPLKSNTFISTLNNNPNGCYVGPLGCLGNDAPSIYKLLNGYASNSQTSPGDPLGYKPRGDQTPYGKSSSIDDFAESFSGYVLRFNGADTTIPYYPDRDIIIATWVNLAGN
jgi:hypothetical protein